MKHQTAQCKHHSPYYHSQKAYAGRSYNDLLQIIRNAIIFRIFGSYTPKFGEYRFHSVFIGQHIPYVSLIDLYPERHSAVKLIGYNIAVLFGYSFYFITNLRISQ
ncbi:unknown [Ruminococcus sp. CAG:353]|nr:unknown [Ruminococcus sp. CAG:353]